MVTTLGNDEPQLDLDLPLGNQDLEDPPTQFELEPLSLPKEHLDLDLILETQKLGLEDPSPIKPLEFNQPPLGFPNPTIYLVRTIGPKPISEPKPSKPLGSTQPDPKDTLDPSLKHNPLKDPTPELGNPFPLGTQTLEEPSLPNPKLGYSLPLGIHTLEEPPEPHLSLPNPELGLDLLELPNLEPNPTPLEALPSNSLEVLPSQPCFVEPNPKTPDLAETEMNMLYLPELEHFEFIMPEHLTLNLIHLLKIEPFEIDLDPKPQPFGESQDLIQDPMMLESSLIHTNRPPLGSTQLELLKRFTALPIFQIEHIEFIIPSHLDILYPKYTNDCGREREFYVGILDWKNMEHGHGLDRMLDTKRLRCCDTGSEYTEDFWIPITFDEEDPPLFHKHHSFHAICNHDIESIFEDQTRLTLDKVKFSYLVKYVHGDKGWLPQEELTLVVPDLITHYWDNSPEENSFPPGEDDGGRGHDPRRYKWSLRLP